MSPAGLKILTCAIQFYVFKWFIFYGALATTENNYMKESVEPKPEVRKVDCYFAGNDWDAISCSIFLSTDIPEEINATLMFKEQIQLNVSCAVQECNFQIKTARHGLPMGSCDLIIFAKDRLWIDEQFTIWANAVNLTELEITSRAAETQCMGLEDISAEEATIDYNCSRLETQLIPHSFNETIEIRGKGIYLKNLVPNRSYSLMARMKGVERSDWYLWVNKTFKTNTEAATVLGYDADRSVYIENNQWNMVLDPDLPNLKQIPELDGDRDFASSLIITANQDSHQYIVTWNWNSDIEIDNDHQQQDVLRLIWTSMSVAGNRSVYVAEHKDISLMDYLPNYHVLDTSETGIRLGWTVLRNGAPPVITWLPIQRIADALSVWQIFNVKVVKSYSEHTTISWTIRKDFQFTHSILSDWKIQLNSQVIDIEPTSISSPDYQYTIRGLEDCKYYEGFIMWNNTIKSPHFYFTTKLALFNVANLTGTPTDNFIDLSWTIPNCNYSGTGAYFNLFLNDTLKNRNMSPQENYIRVDDLESNTVYKIDLQSCRQNICTSTDRLLKTTFDHLSDMYVDILVVESTATHVFTNCSIAGVVDEFYYSLKDSKGREFKSITADQCLFEHLCSQSDESHLNVYLSAGVRQANGSMVRSQEFLQSLVNKCRIGSWLTTLISVVSCLICIIIVVWIIVKLHRRRRSRPTRMAKELRVILPTELNLFNSSDNHHAHDNETAFIQEIQEIRQHKVRS